MNDENKTVECQCGTHILSIRHEKELDCWFISIFKHYFQKECSFLHRIKLAVEVALKGYSAFWDDQIIISNDDMKDLTEYLVEKQKEIKRKREVNKWIEKQI